MLDDHLSGYELLGRLVAAAIPGGRNRSVGHGRHFIPDVIGGGRVFDLHPVSQRQQAPYEIVGPEEQLDAALPGPFLDEMVLRDVGEQEYRYDEDLDAQYAVHRIPDGDGGVPGLGERAGHVPLPVDGLDGSDAPIHGVPAALFLSVNILTCRFHSCENRPSGLANSPPLLAR